MKVKIKKLFASFMVVAMVLTVAPLNGFVGLKLNLGWLNFGWLDFTPKASAEENELAPTGQCGENVYWTFDKYTGLLTISGSGDMYYYNSPFYGNDEIKSVVIERGVTSIGDNSFYGCTSLKNVFVPSTVIEIGYYAFRGCTLLNNIELKYGVTSIGGEAFFNCSNLSTITLPNSVKYVYEYAFSNNTIVFIEENNDLEQFLYNEGYKYVVCKEIPEKEAIVSGIISDKCSWNIDKLSGKLLINCNGHMPSFANDRAPWIAYCKYIKYVEISDGCTKISDKAFECCVYLRNVNIPFSVTSIGGYAFYNCYELSEINIPNSVSILGEYVFYNCKNIINLTIPDSVINIGESSFYGCLSLTRITLPNNITSIGEQMFTGCRSLTDVTIPNFVTNIGFNAFSGCLSLIHINIPNSVRTIGGQAFSGCVGLKGISISRGLESIDFNAFSGCCNLEYLIIPDSVTYLGEEFINHCSNLKELKIPCSAKIGNSKYNFLNCTSLERITITKGNGIMQDYGTSTSSIADMTCYQYTPWYVNRSVIKEIVIENGVEYIGNYAFYNCTGLTRIAIPDSVLNVGYNAFYGCHLEYVKMGDGLTFIPNTLASKDYLNTFTIGNNVTAIDDSAFNSCSKLENIVIPKNVKRIGTKAFTGCTSLEKLKVYSRDCEFADDATAYYTTICGYAGSTAEAYADEYGLDFELISDNDHEHIYLNNCDEECNICGFTRITSHVFDNDCDTECNVCGYKREPSHIDENVDNICDRCGKSVLDITLDEQKDVNILAGETVYLKFIPSVTGIYRFYSSSDYNTYGYIYDSNKNQLTSNDNGGSGYNFSMSYTLKEGTVYYLGVRYYSSYDSGTIPVMLHLDQVICEHRATHTEHKEATCTEKGYYKVICDKCGEIVEYIETSMPHEYIWITIQNPTTEHTGKAVKKCSKCGDIIDEFIMPALIPDFVTGITLSPDTIVLNKGENADISAVVTPDTALNKNVVWSSTNGETVSVSNGSVTALKPGMAVIVAETEDGGYKDFCVVRVVSMTSSNGSVIDNENGIIYGLSTNVTDISEYINLVDKSMKVQCDSKVIGTGSTVNIMQNSETIDSFEIVIFGDVNGDGWYDGMDAMIVSCLANGMLTKDNVSEAVYMAADCNHDGVIDQLDVDILQQAGVLLSQVDQSKSEEELLETSSAYVEYLNLIDQTVGDDNITDNPIEEPYEPSPMPVYQLNIFEKIIAFFMAIWKYIFSFMQF